MSAINFLNSTLGIPTAFLCLGVLLGVVAIWFLLFKRPVYEAILISFIALVALTNTWGSIGKFINTGLSTSLLYSMIGFVAMSIILTKTKIIDSCVAIILALLGKLPGGVGYASILASSFMGALSGSGPGNVMATGALTIPAMKKSGFPAELAANVESNASYLGNMIPPSSNILAALAAFHGLYGEESLTQGRFWIILWGVSLWFILQRLVMLFAFCTYYKVKPLPKEERPSLRQTLKEGWQGLLLPVIILVPFLLDYFFKDTFFTERLGAAGAKSLSSALLIFIPGLVAIISILMCKNKKDMTPHKIAEMFAKGIKTIAPAVGVCIIGYMIGSLFGELNVGEEMKEFIIGADMSKIGLVLIVCVLTCFLGMVIPGSSLVATFGAVFIASFESVGVDPILAAAMLPCICGVMCGITPPLGLGMYAGMSLAESDFSKTFKNNLWWVAGQFIMQVIVLMGWLPILGL